MLKETNRKEFDRLNEYLCQRYPYSEKIVEEIFDSKNGERSPFYREKILRTPDGYMVGLHDCQGRFWTTNAREID